MEQQYCQFLILFCNICPDIAISDINGILTLELTVCHETNFESSRVYKQNKYSNISTMGSLLTGGEILRPLTIEVSTLDHPRESGRSLGRNRSGRDAESRERRSEREENRFQLPRHAHSLERIPEKLAAMRGKIDRAASNVAQASSLLVSRFNKPEACATL